MTSVCTAARRRPRPCAGGPPQARAERGQRYLQVPGFSTRSCGRGRHAVFLSHALRHACHASNDVLPVARARGEVFELRARCAVATCGRRSASATSSSGTRSARRAHEPFRSRRSDPRTRPPARRTHLREPAPSPGIAEAGDQQHARLWPLMAGMASRCGGRRPRRGARDHMPSARLRGLPDCDISPRDSDAVGAGASQLHVALHDAIASPPSRLMMMTMPAMRRP